MNQLCYTHTHYENIKHACIVYNYNICTHLVLSSVSNPSVNDWVQCLAWGIALQITNFMEHGKAAFFPLNVSGTVQKTKEHGGNEHQQEKHVEKLNVTPM